MAWVRERIDERKVIFQHDTTIAWEGWQKSILTSALLAGSKTERLAQMMMTQGQKGIDMTYDCQAPTPGVSTNSTNLLKSELQTCFNIEDTHSSDK